MKFFYILQLAYWFHAFPELYFQKTKKVSSKHKWEELQSKVAFFLSINPYCSKIAKYLLCK